MAIVKQEIEYEFLTRWAHQLTLVDGKYELTKSISGSQVQKVTVIFDDETGDIVQAVTGRAHPVKDVVGVAGGDDVEVFAIGDLLTTVQADALGTALMEKGKAERLEVERDAANEGAITARAERDKTKAEADLLRSER